MTVFVYLTDRTSVAPGLFLCGSRRRAVAQTRPAAPKILRTPSAFPQKGVLENAGLAGSWQECQLTGFHVRRPRSTATETRIHPSRSVNRPRRPTEVCVSRWEKVNKRNIFKTLQPSAKKKNNLQKLFMANVDRLSLRVIHKNPIQYNPDIRETRI